MNLKDINYKKLIEEIIIIVLAILIIINIALIMINQELIVNETFNYCTSKAFFNLEECLKGHSLKSSAMLIPLIVLIVICSVIIIELTSRHLTRDKLKKQLSDIREENELMASPLTAALTTRYLLGIPFHVWDLGFCIGFIIGSLVGIGLLRFICLLMSVWCGLGAYADYKKFKKLWKK